MCIAVPQRCDFKRPFKFLKHRPLPEISQPAVSTFITSYILHYFNLKARKCQTLTIRFPI